MIEVKKENIQYTLEYVAVDGTTFKDKEECIKYEESAKGVLKEKFMNLICGKGITETDLLGAGSDENTLYAVKLEKESDVDVIKQLYFLERTYLLDDKYEVWKKQISETINNAYKNKDILIVGFNCDDVLFINTTLNTLIKRLTAFCNKETVIMRDDEN